MERVRARSCLAVGAIALAMAATAAGAAAAPPRDITADLAPVAARVPVSPSADPVLDDEEHADPTPPPSEDPGMDGDPHGMDAMPSDDPHGGMEDPAHGEEMAVPRAGGQWRPRGRSVPVGRPGSWHGAEPSPEPPTNDHGTMPAMNDEEMASHPPASGGHDEAPAGGHDESAGGHGDEEPTAERPRAVVLGGFVALNGIALAGAAVLRRRDRAAVALKARRISTMQPEKDESR